MAGTLGRMTLPPSWSNDRNGAAFISCICKRFILLLQKRTSHFQVCIAQQKGKPINIAIRCKIRMKEAFISHCLDSKNLLEQKQMKNLKSTYILSGPLVSWCIVIAFCAVIRERYCYRCPRNTKLPETEWVKYAFSGVLFRDHCQSDVLEN